MTILITGVTGGIGKALAQELVKSEHTVIGVGRSADRLADLEKELSSSHFSSYTCDVSNEQSVAELSRKIQPDVIVCAAAICEYDNDPYDHDIVRETMEINFFGTMNFVKAFGTAKHLIAISSIAAWKPNSRSVSYGASKAAIAMAFRGLAVNTKSGVRFSTVYLGPVNTRMWEGKKSWMLAEPEKISEKLIQLIEYPKTVTYMPYVSTTLSRISLLMPDWLYARISTLLFK